MGRSTRTVRPLTAEEQQLAERAFEYARPVAEGYAKRWARVRVDWSGEVALRICRLIPTFDPSRSALRAWAISHANFACQDAIRMKADTPRSRGVNRRLRTVSLDAPLPDDSDHTYAGSIEGPGLPDPFTDDDAAHLLRGLPAIQRAAVWETVVEGRAQHQVARDFGVSEGRISQLRTRALEYLREHRREEACE